VAADCPRVPLEHHQGGSALLNVDVLFGPQPHSFVQGAPAVGRIPLSARRGDTVQDLDLYGVETRPAGLGYLLPSRARLASLGRGSEEGCVARLRADAGRRLASYGIRREDFAEVIWNDPPQEAQVHQSDRHMPQINECFQQPYIHV
jgi:hypothetical protein